jgi:hypothetical protein
MLGLLTRRPCGKLVPSCRPAFATFGVRAFGYLLARPRPRSPLPRADHHRVQNRPRFVLRKLLALVKCITASKGLPFAACRSVPARRGQGRSLAMHIRVRVHAPRSTAEPIAVAVASAALNVNSARAVQLGGSHSHSFRFCRAAASTLLCLNGAKEGSDPSRRQVPGNPCTSAYRR